MSNTKVTFLGAARTVTGSKFLLETSNDRILIDCGLFQGQKQLRIKNWEAFPIPPDTISAVVLTHAHLDHCGYLPRLIKQGYKGPVYCTAPTKDLVQLLLEDSAKLAEEEASYANRYGTSKHHPAEPLYTSKDAQEAIRRIKVLPPKSTFNITERISVTAHAAGHILGASILNIKTPETTITFSGDIGRFGVPLLPDPQPVELGHLLVCESTYGNRLHKETSTEEELTKIILKGVQTGGPILIPSFAIGRAQHLLYLLAKLEREKKIPEIPVFVDSPMAIDATDIYKKYRRHFDDESQTIMKDGFSVLRTKKTFFLHSVDQSKKLNSYKGPRIIIAGSGMVTGGRILHHFMHWISNPTTTVIFVGYQAKGTRGDRILNNEKTIRIFAKDIPVRAHINTLSGLSGHADKDELMQWLSLCSGKPDLVKIVHGEENASIYFASLLKEKFTWNASIAEPDETVILP